MTADVDDEIDVGVKMTCRAEMRDRLDQTEIHAEGVLDERFAVARDGGGDDMYAVAAQLVELCQLLADNVRRVALVGLVVVEQDLVVLADEHELGRGRAAVDAEIGIALINGNVLGHDVMRAVPRFELLILLLGLEQRRQIVRNDRRAGGLFERIEQGGHGVGLRGGACILRCAGRDGIRREGREVRVLIIQTERLLKALLEALEEEQRAAEEQHIALDLAALCEAGDGLVDDRLKNRGCDILLACALIEQRLDVRLGEHAAARSDGVDALRALREMVKLGRGNVEQYRHLVDERAGAAGAGTVHALFQLTGQKDDLRVLAAELDDDVCRRHVHADRLARSKDLLNEVDVRRLGNAETGRAGDRAVDRRILADQPARGANQLDSLFAHLGKMAFIVFVDDLSIAHNDDLDRC